MNTFVSQSHPTDVQQLQLKGAVKSMSVNIYEAKIRPQGIMIGAPLQQVYARSTVEKEQKRVVTFNSSGNITMQQLLNLRGKVIDNQVYEYNPKDQLIRKTWYNDFNEVYLKWAATYNVEKLEERWFNRYDQLKEKVTYQYNSEGQLIRELRYDPYNELLESNLITYNPNGQLSQIESNDFEGELTRETTYQYDSDGNIIQRKDFDPELGIYHIMVAQYNVNQQPVHTRYTHTQYGLLEDWHYTYNDQGLLIQSKLLSKATTTEIRDFQYTLDDQQNWVKMIVFINDRPTYIVDRIIEYYVK